MKKSTTFTILFSTAAIFILQSFISDGLSKRDGTEPGHTGSPGDSLKNCTVCHGGSVVNVEGWITSNIPVEGFEPGKKYAIKATNTQWGNNRFGFQVSPQDLKGQLLGRLVITDTIKTKLVGDNKYVTYRSGGVDGLDSLSWYFDWVAPSDGTNEVVFYGAFNSNHFGHKPSDQTFITQYKVFKQGFTAVQENSDGVISKIYPNPASDYLAIEATNLEKGTLHIELINVIGQHKFTLFNDAIHTSYSSHRFDLNTLESGIYLVKIINNSSSYIQKIMVTK